LHGQTERPPFFFAFAEASQIFPAGLGIEDEGEFSILFVAADFQFCMRVPLTLRFRRRTLPFCVGSISGGRRRHAPLIFVNGGATTEKVQDDQTSLKLAKA
jgi:hypothetical protein